MVVDLVIIDDISMISPWQSRIRIEGLDLNRIIAMTII